MADNTDETMTASKKRKIDESEPIITEPPPGFEPASTSAAPQKQPDKTIIPATPAAPNQPPPAPEAEEYLKPVFSRISAVVSPNLVTKLKNANILGHRRPSTERILKPRYYVLNVVNMRTTMAQVLTSALQKKYSDEYRSLNAKATLEIETIVPLTVNACMIAMYAKLRVIHKAYSQYSSRFGTTPSYTKDLELPLPFAEAISQIGVFEMTCSDDCFLVVPVIPEGTRHECRSTEDWQSFEYESCIQILKDCGIPCKSVNTREKTGSAWWTYKITAINNTYDATMIFAPKHYTDHSMTLALMFLNTNSQNQLLPIVTHQNDDLDYGKFAQVMLPGFQLLAFLALCGSPPEEWNIGTSIV